MTKKTPPAQEAPMQAIIDSARKLTEGMTLDKKVEALQALYGNLGFALYILEQEKRYNQLFDAFANTLVTTQNLKQIQLLQLQAREVLNTIKLPTAMIFEVQQIIQTEKEIAANANARTE